MTISSDDVRKKTSGSAVFGRAESLYRRGRVSILSVEAFWKGEADIKAEVLGDSGKTYRVNLLVKGPYIYDYVCTCPAHQEYRGMCKHAAATALAYIHQEEKLQVVNVRTSPAVREMMKEYESRKRAGLLAAYLEDKVELEPWLHVQKGEVRVEFRIGTDKKYVLKDLYAFADAMETGRFENYGKQLGFYHVKEAFAGESAVLADFIREHASYMKTSSRLGASPAALRELPLHKVDIDSFMSLWEQKGLTFVEANGKNVTRLVEKKDPELTVTIRSKGKNGATILLPETIQVFSGEAHLYVLTPSVMYLCSEAYSEAMGPFLCSMLNTPYIGGHEQDMNQKDYSAFCFHVLPKLRAYAFVDFQDISFDSYVPEPLATRFDIDSPAYNEVTLKVTHSYGMVSFSPLEEPKEPVVRDTVTELAVERTVTRYFKNRYADSGLFSILDDEDGIYAFMSRGISELRTFGEVFISETMKAVKLRSSGRITAGVTVSEGWLKLQIDTDGIPGKELKRILECYRRKKKYYRLQNGDFLSFEDDQGLSVLTELSEGLSLKDKDLEQGEVPLPGNRAFYLNKVLGEQSDAGFNRLINKIEQLEKYPAAIPKDMEGVLREYQKTGFHWLYGLDACHFGGILADDMGLGKTIQVISLLLAEWEQRRKSCSLIVCPASLVFNWEHELMTFAPKLKVVSVVGTGAEREAIIGNCQDCQVLITSYDLLKRDLSFYKGKTFRFQVIDEAQVIKNFNTQSARAVKEIKASTKFALTGTPIENRLSELWSIFDYLMPGFLFHYSKFRTMYETPIVKRGDKEALNRLHTMISPFILRRLKKDVLKDLPDKLEKVMYSRLEGEQKRLYTASALRLKESLEKQTEESFSTNKLQVLSELTRLRQICCDPGLCFEGFKDSSAKLETCIDLIVNGVEAGHKILVFSQFTSMFPIIEKRMQKERIRYFCLTGGTRKEDRIAMVDSFNKDNTDVFLISLKAGGTGLNLTAADIVIHYDPWWNVAAQNQATDRAHRIGQEKVVSVYKLIAKDTVEENILALQNIKSSLAEQIIGGDAVSFGSLTKEELLKILR